MRILVTGGSGGIDRELVPLLVGQGHRVVSLDLEAPPAGLSRGEEP